MLNDPQEMMAAYFAGVLDAEGAGRLADWITASEANARAFASFAIEHHALEHLLRVEKYGDLAVLSQNEFLNTDDADQSSAGRTDLELLSEMEDNAPLEPVVLEEVGDWFSSNDQARFSTLDATQSQHCDMSKRVIVIPRPLFWGGVAALLLIGFWISWQFMPQGEQPIGNEVVVLEQTPTPAPSPIMVATVEELSDTAWSDGESRAIGDQLMQGEYKLSHGTVRLRFGNGALVHVEAPARFSLKSASKISLDEGQLVCHCDTQAQGFEVLTPYGDFVDLGTEFGVIVRPWQESQLHVFKGKVLAVKNGRLDSGGTDSLVVQTAEAIAIGPVHRQAIQPLANAEPDLFGSTKRRIAMSINTGASINKDDRDQQWLVTHVNQQAIDPPIPAALFTPPTKEELAFGPMSKFPAPIFIPNRDNELGWITPDASLVLQDIATTTYQTSFDLQGFDSASVQLEMGFNADNFVSSIRLNGGSIALPDLHDDPTVSPYSQLNRISIQEGFMPGLNQIEIVVTNAKPEARPTYTGLIAELTITARPDWVDYPEQSQSMN